LLNRTPHPDHHAASAQRCAPESQVHQNQDRYQNKQQWHHSWPKSRSQTDHPQNNGQHENCPKHRTLPARVCTFLISNKVSSVKVFMACPEGPLSGHGLLK